ncbi:hypothetical protein [Ideonella sp. YS5]|uniref:hypothetical protein n=1 Tax=Ideonella sp. YS5 TaxID=3453714 RepID=UPI003EEF654B
MPTHKLPPWLQPKVNPPAVNFGVVWYTEAEWAKVKETSVDPERFEASYSEWIQMAEQGLQQLQAMGIVPSKVQVVAQDFFAWCLVKGKQNSAESRSEYVLELGAKRSNASDT